MNPLSPVASEVPTPQLGVADLISDQQLPAPSSAPPPHESASTSPPSSGSLNEIHPSLLGQDAVAQYEMKRYIVASVVRKAGWDNEKGHPYTLRQWLFYQFHRMIKQLKSQQNEEMLLEPSEICIERNLIVELGILCQYFAVAKAGVASSLEARVLKAIDFLSPKYKAEFPWLGFLKVLLPHKEFFHLSIATICQHPLENCRQQKILRRFLITYQWIVTMTLPLEDSRQRGIKIDECYELCMNCLRLSKERERQIDSVIASWDAYSAGRSLAAELEYRYRVVIDEAIDALSEKVSLRTLFEIKEMVSQTIDQYEGPSRAGYTRELQLLDGFLSSLPGDDEFLVAYHKSVSEVKKIVDIDRMSHCKKMLQDMKASLFFSQSVEKFAFLAFKQDLQSVVLPSETEQEVDSFEQADSSELLKLVMAGSSQKSVSDSPSPILPRERKGRESRPLVALPPPVLKESSESKRDILEQKPSFVATHLSILSGCLQNFMSDSSLTEIPRRCTHFAALHKCLLGSRGRVSPTPESRTSEVSLEAVIDYRMRGLFNHLYLGSCGFELVSHLLHENRSDLLSAVLPMWITDRYLMVELHGDARSLHERHVVPETHALVQMIPLLAGGRELKPELHRYLSHLSKGIFWYRYFGTFRTDLMSSYSSEFRWIHMCHQLAKEDRRLSPDEQQEFVRFVEQKHTCAFDLMYHTLAGTPGNEPIEELREGMGAYIGRWKNSLTEPKSTSTKVLGDEMMHERAIFGRLVERARCCLSTFLVEPGMNDRSKIVEEIFIHLVQMRNTIEVAVLFPEPHLFSFYMRNLLNVQWLIEHAYQLECSLLHCSVEKTHNFRVYEEVLTRLPGRVAPHLAGFAEYNSSIGLHYEELYQTPLAPFADYRRILENNCIEATCGIGFTPIGVKPFDTKGCFIGHVRRLADMLERALFPLFEAAIRTPSST